MAATVVFTTVLVGLQAAAAQQPAPARRPSLTNLDAKDPALTDPLRDVRAALDGGRFRDGEQAAREYLRRNDLSAPAHELLAYALLRQNKPREALPEFTRAAALGTPSADMLVHVGQAYALLNDNADADKWTLRAVRADPKNADAWYGLGRVRYTEQRFGDAASCFRKVLELLPKSVKAENNLGLTYEALNQPEAAMAAYRQAMSWQAGLPERERSEQPLLNLAIMLVHQGQLTEAASLLGEAEKLAPTNASVHEQLGHVALQKNDAATAQREFARASELEPGKSSLHFLLGQAYRRLGRGKEAEAEFATAAKLAHETAATPVP